jgi:hypothetical protein
MAGGLSTNPIPVLTAKAPFDMAVWTFDFTNTLGVGDTVASITSIVTDPAGAGALILGQSAIVVGIGGPAKGVGVLISGGTAGTKYLVTCEILTTNGNNYARSFILPVQVR